jgi:hypothetical protein
MRRGYSVAEWAVDGMALMSVHRLLPREGAAGIAISVAQGSHPWRRRGRRRVAEPALVLGC